MIMNVFRTIEPISWMLGPKWETKQRSKQGLQCWIQTLRWDRLAGCLSVRPSVRPSVRLSIPLSICRLSFSLPVCLPVCLFLWDFPEIMMTNGWCDCICLFILQVFTAFSQTATCNCSALSVATAKNTSRTDVSGASTWTHMGRISFLKFQRKDFTREESEAITAPFLSKCYSYRKQRKQKFPFPVKYLPWADLFEHWMTWPLRE